MDDILELETRQKIYSLLRNHPGIHLSKIATTLDLRISHVEYHLRYLEKHGIINSDKHTGYARYFLNDEATPKLKRNFSLLRQETILKIVLVLLKKEGAYHKELLQYLEISPSTLSYHLNRLRKNEIITFDEAESQRIYSIKDPEALVSWLLKYKPYKLLDGFTDIWQDFTL